MILIKSSCSYKSSTDLNQVGSYHTSPVSLTEECGCCGLAKQLTPDSSDLISISANPVLEGANAKVDPSRVEISESNTNPGWCSAEPPGGVPYDPYLTFEFSSTYLIEIVKISGGNESYRYVRTLSIKNDTGQGFAFISDNRIPKVSQLYIATALKMHNANLVLNILEGI